MAKKIQVEILGDSKSVERAFGRAGSSAKSFSVGIGTLVKSAVVLGAVAKAADLVRSSIRTGVTDWQQQTEVAAQTAQVLKTTGGVANVTKQQVDELAQSMLRKTGIDDEAIKTTENLLLGFTNIRNEAGAGNAIFTRATKIVTDYAVRTGKDATRATVIFGKALNDPVKNLGALSRAGIQFTDSQKKQIKALAESGRMAEAQKVVLASLEKRYGGAAEAAGTTLPGKLRILREQWANLSGSLVGSVVPAFSKAIDAAVTFVNRLSAAKGVRAKLSVAWDTARDAASSIQQALSRAIASVDWSAVWLRAQGISDGLVARLQAVDWSGVGETIGNGIATGVGSAAKIGKQLAAAIGQAVRSVDWIALGRAAGPGLAAAMLSAIAALTDPAFWKKNWDLVAAVALTAFGGSIGRIAVRLSAPLVRVFSGMFFDVLGVVERFAPRIANFMLGVFMRLPGLISGIGSRLVGLVGSLFGRLGNLSRFTVKVLGIDVAIQLVADFARKVKEWIDRVVGWFKALPGRIRGAIGNVDLSDIGSSIINSLWDGMKAKWEAVKGWAGKVGGWIKSIKGPPAKDAVLLVENGQLIMQGLLRGLQSGFPATESYLSKVAGRLQAAMSRIQGQLDASQRRATDESNRKALADAEKELAAARKKGKGVADAERAYRDALQTIQDTAAQRQLDRLTKQNDKVLAKLQSLRDKAAAKLQGLRDAAGSAFDTLAEKIQKAFDAKNSAFVSPAQQQINAINERRRQEDLAQAVTDAQQAVADAIENGGDVAGAQLRLQRAQEDIQLASLEKQAEAQDRANQRAVDAQQEQLDTMLGQLRKKLVEEGTVYSDGVTGILDVIKKFDGDFEGVGGLLGEAFVRGLRAAMDAAAGAGDKVKGAGGTTSGTSNLSAGARTLSGASARVVALASGGTITRTGVALVHRGETVMPAGSRGGGGDIYNITLPNYLGDRREVAGVIRDEMIRIKNRTGSAGL